MDAIKALKTRRSVRSYKSDAVPREIIEDIVDCGRLAATARNVQPWEFVVVTEKRTREQLANIAEFGKFIADAPVCIVVFCKDTKYYLEDGSAAMQNILAAARAHGLGSCWVAGDKKSYTEEIRQLLNVPPGHKLIGMIAIGYAAAEPITPPKRPLSEVLHWEKFGGRL